MDYSDFTEFPFPSKLTPEEARVRDYFMNLSDDDQLGLLNGSSSYSSFYDRVQGRMNHPPQM